MSHLEYGIEDGLATLVLNNPPQNRIGPRLVKELAEAIEALGKDGARAVLLRAAGTDFSFGGDIQPWPEWDVHELRTNFEGFMAVFNRFERLRIPVIAAVNGNCFGGGLELVLRSDVVFAGRSAQFCHPEQTLGIVTLLGGVQRMAERVGRSRAMEWALTSERIGAEEMESVGVVNHVVDDDQLVERATDFARKIAQGPTRAHSVHKALLRAWATGGVSAADDLMFDLAIPLWDTEDVQVAIPSAIAAAQAGKPRPTVPFTGR